MERFTREVLITKLSYYTHPVQWLTDGLPLPISKLQMRAGRFRVSTNPTWKQVSSLLWDTVTHGRRSVTCRLSQKDQCNDLYSEWGIMGHWHVHCFTFRDGVPGFSWSEFEPSVKMSTYLVACLVSEFDTRSMVHTTRGRNVTFGYWTRPDLITLTE